ncbi:MAG: large-conductance mechanosensitive channel protein MscL [Flavobacteriales bacterium]|nr:large-conductance mechanosensitive channel protein MscL [Flavobacteriales bacterium]
MMKEFKDFAMKGNLVDIAVGFVMGAAFTKVVNMFTGGIVTPLISLLTEKFKFDELKWVLREGVKDAAGEIITAEVAITYGMFITALIDFLIVAFVMFMVVKAVNNMKKAEPAPPPPGPTNEEKLLMEIRDALKK